MKRSITFILSAFLGACNQTTQTADLALPPQAAPGQSSSHIRAVSADLPGEAEIAPLYEPLIDMNRVNPVKLRKDLAECRAQAAPQEAVARRAAQQQQTGAAIQAVGAVASFIPVPGFRQAHALAGATNAIQSVGANTAENAADAGARATEDYALVVNACLQHRKYRLLRA